MAEIHSMRFQTQNGKGGKRDCRENGRLFELFIEVLIVMKLLLLPSAFFTLFKLLHMLIELLTSIVNRFESGFFLAGVAELAANGSAGKEWKYHSDFLCS